MRSRISSSPAVAVAMKATDCPLLAANRSAKALFPLRAPPRITISRGVTICSEDALDCSWLSLTRGNSFSSSCKLRTQYIRRRAGRRPLVSRSCSYQHQHQQRHYFHHFCNGSIAITRQPSDTPDDPESKHQCRHGHHHPYDETNQLPCDQHDC